MWNSSLNDWAGFGDRQTALRPARVSLSELLKSLVRLAVPIWVDGTVVGLLCRAIGVIDPSHYVVYGAHLKLCGTVMP